ncbi:hypothetical protein QBC38DRAFT_518156 [Podospora fimiseda]|uniref:Uncharacterized protein n=1 Tax=Podospora fimiseda TaxID=252190 RepID=A0AAN6YP62_9PEZI|nr:hypothetical protein QBC38DRAFT_518156 [Podospora fimiseda]
MDSRLPLLATATPSTTLGSNLGLWFTRCSEWYRKRLDWFDKMPVPISQSQEHTHTTSAKQPFEINSFGVSEQDVLSYLESLKRFELPDLAPGVSVTNLPVFDDLTLYDGVTQDIQSNFWQKEVSRLMGVVTSTEALTFSGSTQLSVDSTRSHATLARLATNVLVAMCIVPLMDKQHWLKMTNTFAHDTVNEDDDGTNNDHEGSQNNQRDAFALVDYITAVQSRISLRKCIEQDSRNPDSRPFGKDFLQGQDRLNKH